MAQFCTKCGTSLPEGMRFCTGCGATIDGPAVPAPTAAPPADAFAPLATAPSATMEPVAEVVMAPSAPVATAPPAPSKGSSAMKVVLIVVGVLMFFGMLGIGSCVYLVYRTKQRVRQFEKQVQTSFPTTSAGSSQVPMQPGEPAATPAAAPVDAAVPAYPGAETPEGQTGVVLGMAGLKMQQYLTSDSVDKVAAFYKDKLGPDAVVAQSGNQASVHLVGPNLVVNVAVAVDPASGKTKIVITSIGK